LVACAADFIGSARAARLLPAEPLAPSHKRQGGSVLVLSCLCFCLLGGIRRARFACIYLETWTARLRKKARLRGAADTRTARKTAWKLTFTTPYPPATCGSAVWNVCYLPLLGQQRARFDGCGLRFFLCLRQARRGSRETDDVDLRTHRSQPVACDCLPCVDCCRENVIIEIACVWLRDISVMLCAPMAIPRR